MTGKAGLEDSLILVANGPEVSLIIPNSTQGTPVEGNAVSEKKKCTSMFSVNFVWGTRK